MKLETEDLIHLSEYAIEAAKTAGNIIASYADKDVEVKNKSGGDTYASQVVTEVDLLCEKTILEVLNSTLSKFDLGLLTEESEDAGSRFEKDYFWCIDPIDGTLPFIEKTHGYSVSIGLVSKSGEPKIGVVYDPMKSILYHAIAGVGAFKNEDMWLVRPLHSTGDKLTWVMDRSLKDDPKYDQLTEVLQDFAQLKGMDLNLIQHGGGAMNACWVLENAPAVYIKMPKTTEGGGSLWDYAGSAAIFQESLASASDIYGESLDLNRKDSTFMNHRGVLYASDGELAKEVMTILERL